MPGELESKAPTRRASKGFALLEVLALMTLSFLVFSSVAKSEHFLLVSRKEIDARYELLRSLASTQTLLEKELELAHENDKHLEFEFYPPLSPLPMSATCKTASASERHIYWDCRIEPIGKNEFEADDKSIHRLYRLPW